MALQAALDLFLGKPLDARRVFEASRSVIREVQGLGSGADVAASVYGGDRPQVDLLASGPVDVYAATDDPERLQARIVYRWPLRAPSG